MKMLENSIAETTRQEFGDFSFAGNAGCLVNAAASFGPESLQRIYDRSVILDRQFQ